jgi:hypothetical protein
MARPLVTFVLAAGLIASGALNAHMLLRSRAPRASLRQHTACVPVAAPDAPGLTRHLKRGGPVARIDSCQTALAAQAARLAAVRAEIAANRPWQDLFQQGEPQPARAETLSQLIRDSIKVDGPVPSFALECRSDVCRIQPGGQLTSLLGEQGWFRQVATDEFVVRKEDAYFRLREAPRADGHAFLQQLMAGFRGSGAQERCGARHPDAAGALHVLVTLRAQPGAVPAIEAFFGGQLADTPAGTCLTEAFQAALEQPAIPEGISEASVQAFLVVVSDRPRVQ